MEIIETSDACAIVKVVDGDGVVWYRVIAAVATVLLPEVVHGICKRTVGDPSICNAVYDATNMLVTLRGVTIYKGTTNSLKWVANRGRHKSTAEVSTGSYRVAQGVKTVFEQYRKECSSGQGIPWGNVGVDGVSDYSVQGKYPQGSTRLIECGELLGKSKWELSIMRNEIFARHGYKFHINPKVKAYFEALDWYNRIPHVSSDSDYVYENLLSDMEKRNIALIQQYE